MVRPVILIVEDRVDHRQSLVDVLSPEGYRTVEAGDGVEAIRKIRQQPLHLVLLDLKLPRMDGMEVLQWIRKHRPNLPVVIISAHGTISAAVEAIKMGAYDFLEKPLRAERVLITVQNALRHSQLSEERDRLVEDFRARYRMVGNSPPMREVYSLIEKAAQSESKVLIVGESGTGKELIARAIHHNSARAAGPFVPVNCAAIPEGLIESELFGYKKGAFTGAHTNKPGQFILADKGTVFLDEIGDMSLIIQSKVLRILEEKRVLPVGASEPVEVDVRVIAATNKDLEQEIKEGRFREDLYYRLNVLTINVPPLRERKGDIPALVKHFLELFCQENKCPLKRLEPSAMTLLLDYHWPGNVRELRNLVEKLVVTTPKEVIDEGAVRKALTRPGRLLKPRKCSFREAREEFERQHILQALIANNWRITQTARHLGIQRTYLWKLMQKYGIQKE